MIFSNFFLSQAQLEQMKDIDVGELDCSAKDLNGAAAAMEDLANIADQQNLDLDDVFRSDLFNLDLYPGNILFN